MYLKQFLFTGFFIANLLNAHAQSQSPNADSMRYVIAQNLVGTWIDSCMIINKTGKKIITGKENDTLILKNDYTFVLKGSGHTALGVWNIKAFKSSDGMGYTYSLVMDKKWTENGQSYENIEITRIIEYKPNLFIINSTWPIDANNNHITTLCYVRR